jgi:recombination DNA repair RAD52 pathway protein
MVVFEALLAFFKALPKIIELVKQIQAYVDKVQLETWLNDAAQVFRELNAIEDRIKEAKTPEERRQHDEARKAAMVELSRLTRKL